MIIKPNQPVIFNESIDTCSTDTDYYTQIVDNTDDTQIQFGLDVCAGGTELNPSPNFTDATQYSLGGGWAISSGTLCRTGVGTTTTQTVNLGASSSKYYKVTIVVDSISNGGGFGVYIGSSLFGVITNTGTYTFYGFPNNTQLSLTTVVADSEICISTLSVYEILTNAILAIYNSETNAYVTEISYANNPTYFTFAEDTVTATIDWSALGLSNNCYYACLLDPCINSNGQNYSPVISNCSFASSLTGWTYGAAWSYGGSGNAIATWSVLAIDDDMYQSNVFVNLSNTYTVQVVITAITGTTLVYFGTNLVGTYTTTGTKTITAQPIGNGTLTVQITSGTVNIASVCGVAVATSAYTCNYTSNDFKLSDWSLSCPETLLINACNDENGLGFVFNGSGFSPRLRLQGKLKQAKYKAERVLEEDSNGTKKVVYYNRRKEKSFVADLLPEYIHDFLSTLVGYDRFYINNVAYVVEDDEYNVTYDQSQDNVGSISLLVSEQTQLIRNVNCSSEENSCTIGTNYLLQADNNTQYITLVNGELILINS